MPDRLPGKQPDLDRIELVLEDAREHAHRIIDESVEQAQELLVRRSGHDPFFDALIGSLTGLSEDVRDLRRRLERIEALLRSPAAAPPAERAPAAEPAT
ncbi:MAG: hypothetical protein FJZ92_05995, partial [Chloroflexi bacterium]|nr:hypothetical protein [Chloroflexota bacterium]